MPRVQTRTHLLDLEQRSWCSLLLRIIKLRPPTALHVFTVRTNLPAGKGTSGWVKTPRQPSVCSPNRVLQRLWLICERDIHRRPDLQPWAVEGIFLPICNKPVERGTIISTGRTL